VLQPIGALSLLIEGLLRSICHGFSAIRPSFGDFR
jgi:hypothetical protein